MAAGHEVGARTADVGEAAVFGYGTERDVLGGGRGGEVVSEPDEVEVGGDEEEDSGWCWCVATAPASVCCLLVLVFLGQFGDDGEDGGGEVFEA